MSARPLLCHRTLTRSSAPRAAVESIWISDDLLSYAVARFARSVQPACRRHGSNVPGPLESRRRQGKRKMTYGALPGPMHQLLPQLPSLWDIVNGRYGDTPEQGMQWQPPTAVKEPSSTLVNAETVDGDNALVKNTKVSLQSHDDKQPLSATEPESDQTTSTEMAVADHATDHHLSHAATASVSNRRRRVRVIRVMVPGRSHVEKSLVESKHPEFKSSVFTHLKGLDQLLRYYKATGFRETCPAFEIRFRMQHLNLEISRKLLWTAHLGRDLADLLSRTPKLLARLQPALRMEGVIREELRLFLGSVCSTIAAHPQEVIHHIDPAIIGRLFFIMQRYNVWPETVPHCIEMSSLLGKDQRERLQPAFNSLIFHFVFKPEVFKRYRIRSLRMEKKERRLPTEFKQLVSANEAKKDWLRVLGSMLPLTPATRAEIAHNATHFFARLTPSERIHTSFATLRLNILTLVASIPGVEWTFVRAIWRTLTPPITPVPLIDIYKRKVGADTYLPSRPLHFQHDANLAEVFFAWLANRNLLSSETEVRSKYKHLRILNPDQSALVDFFKAIDIIQGVNEIVWKLMLDSWQITGQPAQLVAIVSSIFEEGKSDPPPPVFIEGVNRLAGPFLDVAASLLVNWCTKSTAASVAIVAAFAEGKFPSLPQILNYMATSEHYSSRAFWIILTPQQVHDAVFVETLSTRIQLLEEAIMAYVLSDLHSARQAFRATVVAWDWVAGFNIESPALSQAMHHAAVVKWNAEGRPLCPEIWSWLMQVSTQTGQEELHEMVSKWKAEVEAVNQFDFRTNL